MSNQILLILAIWFLTEGLAFADSFDLTDEFQNSLFDRAQVLEPDLDELRELVDEASIPTGYLCPEAGTERPHLSDLLVLTNITAQPAKRLLQEVLQTLRI